MSAARVAVLASGRGTNAEALFTACATSGFPASIAQVVCDVPGAGVIARAERAGLPVHVIPSRGRPRDAFEAELLDLLGPSGRSPVDLICLAGFMRVLTPSFVEVFPARILNVHPSLLPAFPGTRAVRDALAAGVTQAGATVHLVDAGVDTGPVLAQGTVPVLPGDDEAALSARILRLEHALYPLCLRWLAEGRVRLEGARANVQLLGGESRWVCEAPSLP
jgi:phosphoribosylglycinamide formyltransferase-1